jgi:dolichyl-diphosphooligosaccharide--protein glycosyltransferase
MKLGDLSKQRITDGLKKVSKLRVKATQGTLLTFSALILIMFVAFAIRILPMRWEIPLGNDLHLSEFDAFFEYRVASYMVNNGLLSPYWPHQWIYTQLWYPEGVNMASDSLPSVPMTGAVLFDLISALGVPIDLMSFCSILPPIFGALCVLIMYFIGKDIGGKAVGMLAALFLALDASFIERSNLGWFETETSMFAFLLFYLMFPRAIEEEKPLSSTVKYSLACGASLAYFIMGWGAAYYLVDLTVLYVFVLLLLRRCTRRVLLAYSLSFGLGLLIAINAPIISVTYLTTFAILPVLGVFLLLCLNELLKNLKSARERLAFAAVVLVAIVVGFTALFVSGRYGTIAGKFLTVLNPFIRSSNALVESVAEHRITAWGSIYYDVGIMILFFLVGLFFISRNLNNRNLFLLVFGLTAVYFAASMVRLLFLLAPAFGLISAVGITGVLKPFIVLLKEPPKITKKKLGLEHVGKEFSGIAVFLMFLILMMNFAFSPQTGGVPNVYLEVNIPVSITAASLPVVPSQPIVQWYDALTWMKNNLSPTTVVVCWWDYGYWLTMMGNVTTLNDNLTINSTQIENVGFIFMANETQSLKMLATYHADYILTFITVGEETGQTTSGTTATYGTTVGYGDEGKWTWMARISGEAQQRLLSEGYDCYWTDETSFGTYNSSVPGSWAWNDAGTNSTIYKLMIWGLDRWCAVGGGGVTPSLTSVEPTYFKEAYFAGESLTPADAAAYGNIIPLVCLYKIDWDAYYSSLDQ